MAVRALCRGSYQQTIGSRFDSGAGPNADVVETTLELGWLDGARSDAFELGETVAIRARALSEFCERRCARVVTTERERDSGRKHAPRSIPIRISTRIIVKDRH